MIWKMIFSVAKFLKECREDKLNAYAAQTAFFILLAIIPFLMVFLTLLQFTPITESMLLVILKKGLPEYISPFFISITDEIYNRSIGVTAVTAVVYHFLHKCIIKPLIFTIIFKINIRIVYIISLTYFLICSTKNNIYQFLSPRYSLYSVYQLSLSIIINLRKFCTSKIHLPIYIFPL